MNILLPDPGEIAVLGERSPSPVRDEVGYLPEERGLYKQMPCAGCCATTGSSKADRSRELDPVIKHWLDRLQLADWADKRVQTLSKGMSQKVQFISAVVSRAEAADSRRAVLRPRSGERRRAARRRARLRRQGTTVVFSTHDMAAAETAVRSHLHDLQGQQGARRIARRDPVAVRAGHRPRAARRRAPRRSPGMPDVEAVNDTATFRTCGSTATRRRSCARSSQKTPVLPVRDRRSRRCTTSSSASRRPTAEDLKPPPGASAHEPHPHRRDDRVPDARPDQGVHHRHPDAAVLLGALDRLSVFAARHADVEDHAFAVIDQTGVLYPTHRAGRRGAQPEVRRRRGAHGPALPAEPGRAQRASRGDVKADLSSSRAQEGSVRLRRDSGDVLDVERHDGRSDRLLHGDAVVRHAARLARVTRCSKEITAPALRGRVGRSRAW